MKLLSDGDQVRDVIDARRVINTAMSDSIGEARFVLDATVQRLSERLNPLQRIAELSGVRPRRLKRWPAAKTHVRR